MVRTPLLPLFFLCVLLMGGATAQPTLTPRLRTFSNEDYRADNQNWSITQSPGGTLFVANTGGVLTFDGLSWTVHQLPGRPTVRAVAWSDDRLYVGGYGAFGYFDTDEGRLTDYTSLSDLLPANERTEEIWNIEVLTSGTVVLQSFSRLYRYAGGDLTTQGVENILFAHATDGRLYVPATATGILTFDDRLDPGPQLAAPPETVIDIAGDSDNLIYATTTSLYASNNGRLQSWSTSAGALLAGHRINRILSLHDGSLAVGTINDGVYLFDSSGTLAHHLNYASGLPNNTVLALFEDRHGDLWVGMDRGLAVVVRSEPLSFYQPGERSLGAVYAAAEYDSTLYVGTNQGLYFQNNTNDFSLVPGTTGQVWELRVTAGGLLCGHNDGTFLVNNNTARRISSRSGGWQTIVAPFNENTLLQANYTGLSLLNIGGGDAGAAIHLEGLRAPLRHIALTAPNRLLALNGSRSAYRIELSPDWRQIQSVDTILDPDLIRAFLADFGDTLLVQSAEGTFLYAGDNFAPVAEFRGVSLSAGEYVVPGREGTDEWFLLADDRIGFYRGIESIAVYPVRLRQKNPDIIALSDSSYLLCLEEGFAIYHPQSPRRKEVSLKLQMTKQHRGVWHFNFALPALDRAVRYRYRLTGFDDRWSAWSTLGEKEYTNLSPKDYTFEVAADWYGARESVTFTVLPPWYRTIWAYLVYVILFMGLLYLLYREHLSRLTQQARAMEAVRERQLKRLRTETRNAELEKDNDHKSRELANTTLALAKKNEMLLDLKEALSRDDDRGSPAKNPQKLLHLIERNLNNEEDWAIFESHFNEVHDAFLRRLRTTHPALTAGDLQLAAYLKMDLSSKEIAPLLHISVRGVENKRYRLRKKLNLDGNDNLNQYVQDF